MHPLTKSLRLPQIVYVLTKEANFLFRTTILAIDLPNVLLLIVPQNKVRSITRRGVRPGSLAPTGKTLKVPPALVAPNYVRNHNASGLPIKDA